MRRYLLLVLITFALALCTAEATTIEWWQFWTDADIKPTIDEIVDEFEKSNPDITVNVTDLTWANGHEKIVIAFASGTGPDVVELGSDWIAQFAANGHLAEMAKADTGEFLGWGMSTYQGKAWAHPWILGTRVLFGNRDLMTQAGLQTGFVPVSWPELRQATRKVHQLGDDIYGWGSNSPEKHRLYKKFMPFFWSVDAQLFSDDGKYCLISSMKAIDALRRYKELHDSTGYVANQRGIEDAFLEGKIGFIVSGDWLLKRIQKEQPDFDVISTLFPGEKFPGKSFAGGEFLAVNSASEHKEAARKLIEFVTSPENQLRLCKAAGASNPSSKQAAQDSYFSENIHRQTFIKQMPMTKHPPVDPDWVSIEDIIERAVEDALFGRGLPADALYRAKLQIDRLKQ